MQTWISILAILFTCASAVAEPVRVAAAISLRDALQDIARAYQSDTGEKVQLVFGSSGQMLAQIRFGADVDLFVSAAAKQVDALASEGLADNTSRRTLVRNSLVVIVPSDSKLKIKSLAGLNSASVQRLAIGEPKTVPAGQYAAEALKSAGIADAMAPRIVYGANVRQVLSYVQRGEVDAGLVYATDARQAGDTVHVVAIAPADSHEPIVYPAVIVKASRRHAAAMRFLDYLRSDKARELFEARGFEPMPEPAAGAAK